MRALFSTAILLFSIFLAHGQISMSRYNDNFRYLTNDTIQKNGWEKLKYMRLSANTNISFGGELREQFQYYHNQNFGDVPPAFVKLSNGQLLQRVMIHTNIEMGNKLRVFAQMGSTFRFFNPNPSISETDENRLNVQQAFIDYHFKKRWLARLGRQEISYASHRLITFREGPNTRLAFDAALFKYSSPKRKIDFFFMSPVISKPGVSDDQSFKDIITGVYATDKIITNKLFIDYYFLNLNTGRRKYNFVAGKENRQSYGFRIFSENAAFNYELEAVYQSGKFNQSVIRAFGFSADINYRPATLTRFIAGVGSNYMSGDKNNNDNRLNTYNLLFSKPQYGLAAPIGATNLGNINPYIKISPTKKSNLFISSYFMWRQSNQDGSYSPSAAEIRPKPGQVIWIPQKKIGTMLALESSCYVNKNLSMAFDASYFFAGAFVKATGSGKNIVYLSFKGTYKF